MTEPRDQAYRRQRQSWLVDNRRWNRIDSLADLKKCISSFRYDVCTHWKEFVRQEFGPEIVRRTLRLPVDVPLSNSAVGNGLWKLRTFAWSNDYLAHKVCDWSSRTLSNEGVRWLFKRYQPVRDKSDWVNDVPARWLRSGGQAASEAQLDWIASRASDELLTCALRLGIRSVEPLQCLPSRVTDTQWQLASVLIDEGVIKQPQDLYAFASDVPEADEHFQHLQTLHDEYVADFRQVVRVLKRLGVPHNKLLALAGEPLHSFGRADLEARLALFDGKAIRALDLFDRLGADMWREDVDGWRYVVDTLKIRSVEGLIAMRPLMLEDLRRGPHVDFVSALRTLVPEPDGLVRFVDLLRIATRNPASNPQDELKALLVCPWCLDVAQLNQCGMWLFSQQADDAIHCLSKLEELGYSGWTTIEQFQSVFETVSTPRLLRLLKLAGDFKTREPAADLARWCLSASSAAGNGAFETLAKHGLLTSLDDARAASRFGHLHGDIIEYLLMQRRLRSNASLRKWYVGLQKDSRLALAEFRGGCGLPAIDQLLLDHAYDRGDYRFLTSNIQAMLDAVCKVTEIRIGHLDESRTPDLAESQQVRADKRGAVRAQIAAELVGPLTDLLRTCEGRLLATVLVAQLEAPDQVSSLWADLNHLRTELAEGRGPCSAILTTIESEAIAQFYGLDAATIALAWPKLMSKVGPQMKWNLPATEVKWTDEADEVGAKEERLPSPVRLDWLGAVSQVLAPFDPAALGEGASSVVAAMHYCLNALRRKALRSGSAECLDAAPAAALVMAAAQGDRYVQHSMARARNALAAYERGDANDADLLHVLANLFGASTLHASETLYASLRSVAGDELSGRIERLVDECTQGAEESSFTVFATLALRPFVRKVEQLLAKCPRRVASDLRSKRRLVVTKHPCAYFAKSTFRLCSRDNLAMWQEDRHLHVLVVDPEAQRLDAMAMFFVQQFTPGKGPQGLVVRGINAHSEVVRGHGADTIVSSLLSFAVDFAAVNGLAAVAVPWGADLRSNDDALSKAFRSVLDDRWPHTRSTVPAAFYPYETRNGSASDGSLELIWART